MGAEARVLAEVDPIAYDDLAALLRDETIEQRYASADRPFTRADRERLLEEMPSLVPVYKCACGDAVCLTYRFRERSETARLVQLEVPGIAVLELTADGSLVEFERITDTLGLSEAQLLRPAASCVRVREIRRGQGSGESIRWRFARLSK